jgi:hypothetical protein
MPAPSQCKTEGPKIIRFHIHKAKSMSLQRSLSADTIFLIRTPYLFPHYLSLTEQKLKTKE